MNDSERDALLIRLDERQKAMSDDIIEFKKIVQVVEKVVTDIKWLKGIGASAVGIASTIAGIIAYFKH